MTSELYKKHRPTKLSQVRGQDEAVDILQGFIKKKRLPHAILFCGGSGCGKTTLARILRKAIGCGDEDFFEENASDKRGIDFIRELNHNARRQPLNGRCRVWLLDEVHALTKDAQNAFLKLLEDSPKKAYFFLATTDPQKLLKTVKTRCTTITLRDLSEHALAQVIEDVLPKANGEVSSEVIEKLAECSGGSARQALVTLDAILGIGDEEEQLAAIQKATGQSDSFAIAKILLWEHGLSWPKVAAALKNAETALNEPEGARRHILSMAGNALLKGGKGADRAYLVIDAFREHFFDSGKAGLISACYEVATAGK